MEEKIKVNSFKAWFLGIRPTSLGASLMTVMLGAGLAHGYNPEQFSWTIAIMCWLFAWLMHIAANLINDVVDFKRGLDKSDPERIDRIYANGLITQKMAYTTIAICLILGCLVGLGILYMVWDKLLWGGWEIVLMGAIVVACTFLYSTTFAYRGLGDLAVLLCFGFIPVCGTFYVLTYTITWNAVWASILAGCSIDTLLIVNNYRDRDEDYEAGKYTSVGILDEPFGRWSYLLAGLRSDGGAALPRWCHHVDRLALLSPTLSHPAHRLVGEAEPHPRGQCPECDLLRESEKLHPAGLAAHHRALVTFHEGAAAIDVSGLVVLPSQVLGQEETPAECGVRYQRLQQHLPTLHLVHQA